MGPLFVLIFWAIAAAILSVIGGTVLVKLVAFLTRGVPLGRRRALTVAGLLPAAGFAYLFFCVIAFSIWSGLRDRDWGWGDTWDTPIIGDYHLMMIDVTDNATIYSRSDKDSYNGKKAINGVHQLEVRGPLLLASANPGAFMEYPAKSPDNLFFILHTDTGVREDYPSIDALSAQAERLGQPLHLEPVARIYERYRYIKLDLIPLTFFAIPPIGAAVFLTRSLLRLMHTRPTPGIEM